MDPFKILHTDQIIEGERRELGLATNDRANALCLSGGGIRSAAFCLGALQAFAERDLLHEFHYLSTVSGGGYIGGWLTRWIAEQTTRALGGASKQKEERCSTGRQIGNVIAAEQMLKNGSASPINELRKYTNYLTPHPGLISSDTDAGVILYLRNLLINWAIFSPFLLALASIPVLYLTAVCILLGLSEEWLVCTSIISALLGLCCLVIAVLQSCISLPSHLHPDPPDSTGAVSAVGSPTPDRGSTEAKKDGFGLNRKEVFRRIVCWALIWAFLAPLSIAPLLRPARVGLATLTVSPTYISHIWWSVIPYQQDSRGIWILPVLSCLACLLAYGLAWIYVVVIGYTYDVRQNRKAHNTAFLINLPAWLGSSFVSAGALFFGAWLAQNRSVFWIVLAGPVWVMIADMLRSTAYVAVRKESIRADLDREWLARLNGDKLRFTFAFALAGTSSLFLPILFVDHFDEVWAWIVAAAGFLAGPVTAMIGRSAKTVFLRSGKDVSRSSWLRLNWIIVAGVLLFGIALLALFGWLSVHVATSFTVSYSSDLLQFWRALIAVFILISFCLLVAFGLGKIVNINQFSMHGTYRNRIVRAFLGSARRDTQHEQDDNRSPDRYTEFDPHDDIRISDAFALRQPRRLFPVINVALNRTSGKDTARAERKAEPFTITPLHCGAASLDGRGAYVPTRCFAGGEMETGPGDAKHGITLGTALAISGAAVSPNMGYYSSPLVAFVMTLFNVRLGAWLPNPGMESPREKEMKRDGPPNAVRALMQELSGQSDEDANFIYLSDGGHFDNLGLHEMLRRQCRSVVIIDAGHDENYAYADLGRTLQHALIDLGVNVRFVQPIRVGDKSLPQHGAYARITYRDESSGELLYIKPWLPGEAPTELKAFQALKESFPHESTANQFFTESDFESYRRLGEYLVESMLNASLSSSSTAHLNGLERVFAGAQQVSEGSTTKYRWNANHEPCLL